MPRSRPLLRAAEIHERVIAMGRAIADHHAHHYSGEPLVMLVLMDGAFCFAADLARAIPVDGIELVFRRASSYRGGTVSTGAVELDPLPDLNQRQVLVIDDILDTGRTLAAAVAAAERAGAATVTTCVLLDKPSRRVAEGLPRATYVGFTIPDLFVVGYGLDHAGRWRGLPDICVIPESG